MMVDREIVIVTVLPWASVMYMTEFFGGFQRAGDPAGAVLVSAWEAGPAGRPIWPGSFLFTRPSLPFLCWFSETARLCGPGSPRLAAGGYGRRFIQWAVTDTRLTSPPTPVTVRMSRTCEVAVLTTRVACLFPPRVSRRPWPPWTGPRLVTSGSVARARKAAARTPGGAGNTATRLVSDRKTPRCAGPTPPPLRRKFRLKATIHAFSAAGLAGSF